MERELQLPLINNVRLHVFVKLLFVLLMALCPLQIFSNNVAVVQAQQHAKMPLLLVSVTGEGSLDERLIDMLAHDLGYSDQFAIQTERVARLGSKAQIKELFKKGYPLAVFLKPGSSSGAIEWRIYDTAAARMVAGKSYTKRGSMLRGWAHNIADALWPALTGYQGMFSSRIAFCKEERGRNGALLKHIYVADYDGSYQQKLITTPTVNVAPRWNNDKNFPLLFYSEFTSQNVRLMRCDMKKRRAVASNFEGLNILPAFSDDGKRVVYCASRASGSCQLYYYDGGTLKQLTNKGNNLSPTLCGDTVYYCSDAHGGSPAIYRYNLINKKSERLTTGASCMSPAYCKANNKLAYCKNIKGTMQIMVYDFVTKTHQQCTFKPGDKSECCWSPCGNYLMFCAERAKRRGIYVLNVHTRACNDVSVMTQASCSYPAWSPVYDEFPVVT